MVNGSPDPGPDRGCMLPAIEGKHPDDRPGEHTSSLNRPANVYSGIRHVTVPTVQPLIEELEGFLREYRNDQRTQQVVCLAEGLLHTLTQSP